MERGGGWGEGAATFDRRLTPWGMPRKFVLQMWRVSKAVQAPSLPYAPVNPLPVPTAALPSNNMQMM